MQEDLTILVLVGVKLLPTAFVVAQQSHVGLVNCDVFFFFTLQSALVHLGLDMFLHTGRVSGS